MSENKNLECEIKSLLAGFNCGACGYGDCAGLAKAIKEKKATAEECLPIDEENIEKINKLMSENKS